MPTITTVDATWDTGITLDAAELRRADTAMFLGDGTANGVRGGIVRHGDTSLAVSVNGSDQVTVQPGAFVIPAATGLGSYRGSLQSATSAVALTARNGTNPRIDLIVIQATGSGATVKTIDGTPGASPSAPALPAQHIELARVTVPAVGGGAVTVDSTWRAYAAALGGTLYVENSNRLPGSGNQKGQRAVALDTGAEYLWSGSAWLQSHVWITYAPTWAASGTAVVLGNGTVSGRYSQMGKTVHYRISLVIGSTTSQGTGFWTWTLPVPSVTGRKPMGTTTVQTPSGALPGFATLEGATTIIGQTSTGAAYAPGTPATLVAGDFVTLAGTYEAA